MPNQFLYVTDIKSAYPSTDSDRIWKNLERFLKVHMNLSFPHFTEEQKNRFIDVIVTITTNDFQLPQGAPTSSHLLNIAFAKTDTEIAKYLY